MNNISGMDVVYGGGSMMYPRKMRGGCSQSGGFLPAVLAGISLAKAIQPASNIKKVISVIPGAQQKLADNPLGRVFTGALDTLQSLGFGEKQGGGRKRKGRKKKRKH